MADEQQAAKRQKCESDKKVAAFEPRNYEDREKVADLFSDIQVVSSEGKVLYFSSFLLGQYAGFKEVLVLDFESARSLVLPISTWQLKELFDFVIHDQTKRGDLPGFAKHLGETVKEQELLTSLALTAHQYSVTGLTDICVQCLADLQDYSADIIERLAAAKISLSPLARGVAIDGKPVRFNDKTCKTHTMIGDANSRLVFYKLPEEFLEDCVKCGINWPERIIAYVVPHFWLSDRLIDKITEALMRVDVSRYKDIMGALETVERLSPTCPGTRMSLSLLVRWFLANCRRFYYESYHGTPLIGLVGTDVGVRVNNAPRMTSFCDQKDKGYPPDRKDKGPPGVSAQQTSLDPSPRNTASAVSERFL
jgi:hypothetical protein